jgi:hypothetical protein
MNVMQTKFLCAKKPLKLKAQILDLNLIWKHTIGTLIIAISVGSKMNVIHTKLLYL